MPSIFLELCFLHKHTKHYQVCEIMVGLPCQLPHGLVGFYRRLDARLSSATSHWWTNMLDRPRSAATARASGASRLASHCGRLRRREETLREKQKGPKKPPEHGCGIVERIHNHGAIPSHATARRCSRGYGSGACLGFPESLPRWRVALLRDDVSAL